MSEETPKKTTRLGALRALAVGALGLAAGEALAHPRRSNAADGSGVVLGQNNNTSTSKTQITSSGGSQIVDDGAFVVDATNADWAIGGVGSMVGVYGSGATGVSGIGNVGGAFTGDWNALSLTPQTWSGAPTSGDHLKGDLQVDSDGVLWLCVANGTPGTWIRVSHGGVRMLPTPQRAYSSTDVGSGAPLNQGETRTIQIASAVAGVPSNALAIVANLTVHSTISGGYLTAYPAGTPQPATSSINWSGTGLSIANGATIGLGPNGAIAIFADAGVPAGSPATHVIVDVAGYVL
jgi:hypothetical protein